MIDPNVKKVAFPVGGASALVWRNDTRGNGNFWETIEGKGWETTTFESFKLAISSDTTVIDFGDE